MRNEQIHRITLPLVLVVAVAGCARVQVPAKRDRSAKDPQAIALDQLRAKSTQPPKLHFDGGIPRFASLHVPVPKDAPDDPTVRALDFLERYRDLYRLQNPRTQLYLEHTVSNDTGQHVFFGQRDADIPVFGAQLAVHLSKDAVIATNGNYLTTIPPTRPSALDEMRAEALALKDMGAKAERIGQPKLVYFNRTLFMTPTELAQSQLDSETHQAWRLTIVKASDDQAYIYFIDDRTGATLFRLNMSPGHAANKSFDIRSANGSGPTFFCGYSSGTTWFDETHAIPGATPAPDAEGYNASKFTHQIYDFFFTNFHRHAWDGNDGTIRLYLDDGSNVGNSQYEPHCGQFIFGDNQATLDTIAHELTHGITATAAGGGLIYAFQSGALNESYSDVFGALIDGNWTIGEDTQSTAQRCLPATKYSMGTDRDLSDPPACTGGLGPNQPDHLSNFVVVKASQDHGGVHTNSGIPNKVAFLIAAGGIHKVSNIPVVGIGRAKTAQLYYAVLTSWLTNNATFDSARNATVQVAQIFVAAHAHGFTSADVCAVGNAFASAGVGLPDLDCDGVDDVADTDDDADTIVDTGDNCPRVSNPGQQDSDGNGIGDACEDDDDKDGVTDAKDNCPLKANFSQADKDSDGFGDVCDDSDHDGVFDSVDNCPYHGNPSQSDADGNGIGDACDPDRDGDGFCNEVGPTFFGASGPVCSKVDNCPVAQNPSQLDSDGDGEGDACDRCPMVANIGLDSDHDGIDNACEQDDDDDGILDVNDNCPTVHNPDQRDLNGNGKGTACDPDDHVQIRVPHQIVGAVQFRRDYFDRQQIVIRPDICIGRDCIPKDVFAEIKVRLEIDLPIRIVDDQGFVVAQSGGGLEKVLRFRPKPDFFSLPPGDRRGVSGVAWDALKPYQSRQYYLEMSPSRSVDPDHSYKINIEAAYGLPR